MTISTSRRPRPARSTGSISRTARSRSSSTRRRSIWRPALPVGSALGGVDNLAIDGDNNIYMVEDCAGGEQQRHLVRERLEPGRRSDGRGRRARALGVQWCGRARSSRASISTHSTSVARGSTSSILTAATTELWKSRFRVAASHSTRGFWPRHRGAQARRTRTGGAARLALQSARRASRCLGPIDRGA